MMNTNKESNKTRALVAAIILCISLLFTTGCSSADVTNDVKSALGMVVAAVCRRSQRIESYSAGL